MRKLTFLITIISILIFAGCIDREIIDSKPGESIDPVTNLDYTISDTDVSLTWSLPTSFPNDILQPVSASIKITKNGVMIVSKIVEDAPTSFTYSGYESTEVYRVTVKVVGDVDTTDPNLSKLRYSYGETVGF